MQQSFVPKLAKCTGVYMIQDIAPYIFDNSYTEKQPDENSIILIFQEDTILISNEEWSRGKLQYPIYSEIMCEELEYQYLFCISGIQYFWGMDKQSQNEEVWKQKGLGFISIPSLRDAEPKHQVFAGITGCHLFHWYQDNVFCGHCGNKLIHDENQRVLKCKNCENEIYPRISPGVIVAVIDGERLLLTKYAGRTYKKYALVAGFSEIGESLEETVKREVMEEVGLKVKNIRYYKSQPWANSGTLLSGFYADLDGSSEITLEEDELSEGIWVSRTDITVVNEDYSLTNEMILQFKEGKI